METVINEMLTCVKSMKFDMFKQLNSGNKWVYSTQSLLIDDSLEESLLSQENRHYIDQDNYNLSRKDDLKSLSLKIPSPPVHVPEKNLSFPKTPEHNKHLFNLKKDIKTKDIVFVRLSPSIEEVNTITPYSDEAGKVLNKIIDSIKWTSVYKTYLYKQHVDYISKDSTTLSQCVKDFFFEMEVVNPKIIICWGERVSQMIRGMNQPLEELRKQSFCYKSKCHIFFSWDPFYFMKLKKYKSAVWKDIQGIDSFYKQLCADKNLPAS